MLSWIPAGAPAAATRLLLQLCTDTSGLPLTPQHITTPLNPDPGSSSGGFTTPSKTPSSISRTAAAASSSKKSHKKGSASKAGQQQQQGSSGSGAFTGSSKQQGDAAAQWQLRLLQAGIDWSNMKHRQLLQQLAHRQLMGRLLLPGAQMFFLLSVMRQHL
jgi:hypothetical protein